MADLNGLDPLALSGEDARQGASAQAKLTALIHGLDLGVAGPSPGGHSGGDDSNAQSDQDPEDVDGDRDTK